MNADGSTTYTSEDGTSYTVSADENTYTYFDSTGALTEMEVYTDDGFVVTDATGQVTYSFEYYVDGSYLEYDVTDTIFPVKLYSADGDTAFKGTWTYGPTNEVTGHSGEAFV